MLKEVEIIEKIKLKIQERLGTIIPVVSAFTSYERGDKIIVIGVSNTTQVNVGLPDYKFDVEVLIDFFVEQDSSGSEFTSYCQKVQDKLSEMMLNKTFELPIVGMLFDGCDYFTNTESNRAVFKYSIYASYPI